MATAPSHRSPSPVSGRRSPNHRTPETINSIRRIFNGNPMARPSISAVPRGFNPVTPANSPADFPRRHSISREGVPAVRTSLEKENEKDRNCSKPIRAKSPVISTGTKNFMAPTISAASKISPSPRKKVLTERNEAVRTSLTSHSEGKSLFHCLNSSETEEAGEIRSKSEMDPDSQVLPDTPKVSAVSFEPRIVEFESKENLGASSLPIPSPDVDSSVPPYDPRTNYLSPRPMFLRYKPNPRIEVYLNREKDFDPGEGGKSLEDSFTSSCSDDTEPTEENQSPNCQKDSDGAFSSEVEDKIDKEDTRVSGSETDTSNAHEENSLEESDGVTEIPHSRSFARPKVMSFLLVLVIACLFVSVTDSPVLRSSSLINQPFDKLYSPALRVLEDPSLRDSVTEIAEFASSNVDRVIYNFKRLSFDKLYAPALRILEDPYLRDSVTEIAEFASSNLERVIYNFKQLAIKSLACLFNAISLLREEDMGSFHFGNLTAQVSGISASKMLADANQIKECYEIGKKQNTLQLETDEEIGQAANEECVEMKEEIKEPANEEHVEMKEEIKVAATVLLEEGHGLVPEAEGEMEEEIKEAATVLLEEGYSLVSEAEGEIEQASKHHLEIDSEWALEKEVHALEFGHEIEHAADKEQFHQFDTEGAALVKEVEEEPIKALLEKRPTPTSHAPEKLNINSRTGINPIDVEITENSNSGIAIETPRSLEEIDSMNYAPVENEFPSLNMLAISSIVLTLVASAFFYLKQNKSQTAEVSKIHDAAVAKKMGLASVSASSDSDPCSDRMQSYYHKGPTEVEVIGESGPYEVSSSLHMSSSHGPWRSDREEEVQSYERKGRRSSNYSSSESPSYGSFTSYEKLQRKQGCGDDEAMTPVRRSSRLRKQVTSP